MIIPKMMLRAVRSRMFRLHAALLLMFVVCLQGYADEGAVGSIRFQRGYFLTRENIWKQDRVSLTNTSQSPQDVSIEISTRSSDQGKLICSRDFNIPPQSRVLIPLISRQRDIPKSRAKEVKGLKTEIPIIVYDKKTGRKIHQSSSNLVTVASNSVMLGFVRGKTEPADEYSYIDKSNIIRKGRTLAIGAQALPSRWFGHDLLDIVILNGVEAGSPTPSQVEGLLDWVARGGVMAVMSSELNNDLITGPISQACGVSVVGVHREDNLKVESNVIKFNGNGEVKLAAPFPMTELCVDDAEVIARANGLPFITRKAFGAGWVFTIACTSGALNSTQLHPVWTFIDKARARRPAIDPNAFAASADKTLTDLAGRRSVNQNVPAGIIAALAIVGTVIWLVRLRSKSPEMSWLYLIPLCVVVSLVMVIWGMTQSDPQRLSYVTLISSGDSGTARVQSLCSYYPGGQSKEKSFKNESPRGIIRDVGKAGSAALGTTRLKTESTLVIPETTIPQGGTKAVYLDEIKPMDVMQVQVGFDEKGVTGKITNRLDVDLKDAVILANERIVRIGLLPSGKTVDVDGKNESIRELGDYVGKLVKSEGDKRRNDLLFKLNPYYKSIQKASEQEKRQPRRTRKRGEKRTAPPIAPNTDRFKRGKSLENQKQASPGALVIANGNYCPVNPVVPSDDIPTQGMCLVSCPVQIIKPSSGAKVLIPSAWVNIDFGRAALWNPNTRQFRRASAAGRVGIVAKPPQEVGNLIDASVELNLDIFAPDHIVEIRGVPTGSIKSKDPRVVIQKFNKPSGVLSVTIPDADRFVTDDRSGFKIEVYVSPVKSKADAKTPGRIAGGIVTQQIRNWQILGVEVSLEGKTQ